MVCVNELWNSSKLSQLPPKSVPLLVRAAFGGRRHRSYSHRRSTFHFSICFVMFSRTPGLHSLITWRAYNPLIPAMCVEVFVVMSLCTSDWFATSDSNPYFVVLGAVCFAALNCSGCYPFLLSCAWLPCSKLRTSYTSQGKLLVWLIYCRGFTRALVLLAMLTMTLL